MVMGSNELKFAHRLINFGSTPLRLCLLQEAPFAILASMEKSVVDAVY